MHADTVYKRGGSSGYPAYPTIAPIPYDPLGPIPMPVMPESRFGMLSIVIGIADALSTNRLYPDARSRTSGYGEPGTSGTATPANSWW